MEIWKDIKGYEGLYQVSDLGRVKSLERSANNNRVLKERMLKQAKTRKGYLRVKLYKEGSKKTVSVHRLVAEAFIPNPNNLPEVNHKKGIKTDNRASELEWNTTKENIQHAYKTGLCKVTDKHRQHGKELGEKYGKFNSKKVIQCDKQGNFIKEWDSMTDVERELKIHCPNISKCCKGILKTTGGYIWKYADTK